MKKTKQVIGIRCHNFDESEQFLYDTLRQYFSEDEIFFIVDELAEKKSFPDGFNTISLDLNFIETNQLLNRGKVAWACGDYFYYAFSQQVAADFYWLIEPDVFLNLKSVSSFFEFFADNLDDALVTKFKLAAEAWPWYKSAKQLLDPPYSCFFPLTRLSKNAIDIMYAKRKSISADYVLGKYHEPFPNDESLLANALMELDIQPVNFTEYFPDQFQLFTIRPFKNKQFCIDYHPDQIIHPVKAVDFYKHAIKNNISEMFDKRMLGIVQNALLDEHEFGELQAYALELFSSKLTGNLYEKNKVIFSLQRLVVYFRQESPVFLKRVVRADKELRIFMGGAKAIVFLFKPEVIEVYKSLYDEDVNNPKETLLKTLPIELLDSFDELKTAIEAILLQHENKNAALKAKMSQAS